jgi:hypothetical protein
MTKFVLAAAVLAAVTAQALAEKKVPARPYVQSGPDGVFFARCVPDEKAGPAGTKVYKVGRENDELLDSYDWHAPEVTLGWSPTAGKVAVMARGGKQAAGAEPVKLSFHLGGKHLVSYTTEELGKLGVEVAKRQDPGGPVFRVVGCEQLPGTNDYDFVIESKGKRLAFDITTGKLRAK